MKSCQSHLKCEDVVEKRVEEVIEWARDNRMELWRKANERRLKVTERYLCAADTVCKNDLSLKVQPALVELQQLKDLILATCCTQRLPKYVNVHGRTEYLKDFYNNFLLIGCNYSG